MISNLYSDHSFPHISRLLCIYHCIFSYIVTSLCLPSSLASLSLTYWAIIFICFTPGYLTLLFIILQPQLFLPAPPIDSLPPSGFVRAADFPRTHQAGRLWCRWFRDLSLSWLSTSCLFSASQKRQMFCRTPWLGSHGSVKRRTRGGLDEHKWSEASLPLQAVFICSARAGAQGRSMPASLVAASSSYSCPWGGHMAWVGKMVREGEQATRDHMSPKTHDITVSKIATVW